MPRRALGQAGVGLRHRAVGVREPVELEVVGAPRRARRAPRARRRAAPGCSTACSTNAGTHCSVTSTRMPSAPRPSATAGSSSAFSVSLDGEQIAGCRHQRRADDLGRDAAEPGAGAVGAGRDRAGDRLTVDVAEVLHREPVRRQQRGQLVQARAGEERHARRARRRPRRVRSGRVRSSSTPGATAMPVKLCPAPTALTRHAAAPRRPRTARCTAVDRARELDALRAAPTPCVPSSATCRPDASQERLPFAAVGGQLADDRVAVDEVVADRRARRARRSWRGGTRRGRRRAGRAPRRPAAASAPRRRLRAASVFSPAGHTGSGWRDAERRARRRSSRRRARWRRRARACARPRARRPPRAPGSKAR